VRDLSLDYSPCKMASGVVILDLDTV